MKTYILALACALLTFGCYAQLQLPKLSPRTQEYLLDIKGAGKPAAANYVYRQTAAGMYMSGIIKVSPAFNSAALSTLGVNVATRAGRIWTVMVPVDNVPAFTKVQGIEYIELDEPVCLQLDSVRKATHVDSVHRGINLPQPYAGRDVVVGIVDAGFDYTHPVLYDTLGHTYRVKRIWEQKENGTAPADFGYGNEITDTNAMKAAGTDFSSGSHGTHVTGIAGGSGVGSPALNTKYRGMAYESDLVLVGIRPDSSQFESTGVSDFIDGINYVFKYAASVQKPAVANLSWGNVVGPRDGTSLFSQAVDALTGNGKIFVCSAGNNGEDSLHLKKTFTATDTLVSTFIGFDPYLPMQATWVDVWGDSAMQLCVKVSLYNNTEITSTGFVCLNDTIQRFTLTGSDGKTCTATITTSTAEFNGRPRIYISLYSFSTDSVCLTLRSNAGNMHLWNGYVYVTSGYYGKLTANGRPWATAGDANYTCSDLVSTQSCIAAAAFTAKNSFHSITGGNYGFGSSAPRGDLAPFTSTGPTADERMKPDIAAPGMCVVSAVSSFDSAYMPNGSDYISCVNTYTFPANNRKYYFAQSSGTSMASPATAGIVALMLQANPLLAPQDVKTILNQTAILDTFTGPIAAGGHVRWGHGKINAFAAVSTALTYQVNTGIAPNNAPALACTLYPNPGNGNFTLNFSSTGNTTLGVAVYTCTGQLLQQQTWATQAGLNTKSFNLGPLPAGVYFVYLTGNKQVNAFKYIVQ